MGGGYFKTRPPGCVHSFFGSGVFLRTTFIISRGLIRVQCSDTQAVPSRGYGLSFDFAHAATRRPGHGRGRPRRGSGQASEMMHDEQAARREVDTLARKVKRRNAGFSCTRLSYLYLLNSYQGRATTVYNVATYVRYGTKMHTAFRGVYWNRHSREEASAHHH